MPHRASPEGPLVAAGLPWRRSCLLALALTLFCAAALLILAEGTALNEYLFEAAAGTGLFTVGHWVSEISLMALAGGWALCAAVLAAVRRWAAVALMVAGGFASLGAYAVSRSVKALFTAPRPCHVMELLADCPAADSWTYPSNHTVIAFALAVTISASVRRLAAAVLPIAALAGAARIFAGHHYPQDVLAGAVLGTSVVLAIVLLAAPLIRRVREAGFAGRAGRADPEGGPSGGRSSDGGAE